MKKLFAVLLLIGCATTNQGGSAEGECPKRMTELEQRSGWVQCRAECASWGRNIVEFDSECRCICTQPVHQGTPYAPPSKTATPGKTPNTQI